MLAAVGAAGARSLAACRLPGRRGGARRGRRRGPRTRRSTAARHDPGAATGEAGRRPVHGLPASPRSPRWPTPATRSTPPGPRRGALSYGDILVYDPDSLSDETISAIRHLKGVHRRRAPGDRPGARSRTARSRSPRSTRDVPPLHPWPRSPRSRTSGTGSPAARWRCRPKLGKRATGRQERVGEARRRSKDAPAGAHRRLRAAGPRSIDAVVNEEVGQGARGSHQDNALIISTLKTSPAVRPSQEDREAPRRATPRSSCSTR